MKNKDTKSVTEATRDLHRNRITHIQRPTDRKIYKALLHTGSINRDDLTAKTGIPRTTVFESLKRLIDLGFVREFIVRSETARRGRPKKFYKVITVPIEDYSIDYAYSQAFANMFTHLKDIDIFISKMSDIGPVPTTRTSMKSFGSPDEIEHIVTQQSIFYQVALGQGDSPAEGLFGPFPIRSHPDRLAYVYSFRCFDSTVMDSRMNNHTHAILVITFHNELETHFPSRRKVESQLAPLVQDIADLSHLPEKFACHIQSRVIGLLKSNSTYISE
jgi:predicted transcriptional regulator